MKALDLVGRRSGRLVVRELHSCKNKKRYWLCDCDCGGTALVTTPRINGSRPTLSCGCLHREAVGNTFRTHGRSQTSLYRIWSQMIQRCTNSSNPAYSKYGGRGITICKRWVDSFEVFAADIGDPPSPKYSIDRIDNDKGYEPCNVRWATRKEQARNRRSNRLVAINGETKTLAEWLEHLNLNPNVVEGRLRRGMSHVEALSCSSHSARRPR